MDKIEAVSRALSIATANEFDGAVSPGFLHALDHFGFIITEKPKLTLAERDAARKEGTYYVKRPSGTCYAADWSLGLWHLPGFGEAVRSCALRAIDERRLEDLVPPEFVDA